MIKFQDIALINAVEQNKKSSDIDGLVEQRESMEQQESMEERVRRLYTSQGGPLVGWLFDEARRRRQNHKEMSAEIGVTYGYISQLKNNIRSPAHISQTMADACARYLGVPAVVIKLLAGSIKMSDFVFSHESEGELLDRAIRKVQDDPQIRSLLPDNLSQLPLAAKKTVLLMYAEVTGQDIFGYRELPNIVRLLQKAAMFHEENEFSALDKYQAIVRN